jgi:hypothetical protein
MTKLVTYVFQLCLVYLRKNGCDIRLVYDNPKGTLTFQGMTEYAKKISLPKKEA